MVKGVPASEEEIAYMRKLAEEHPDWTGDKICLQSFRDEKSDTLRHKSFLTQHDIRLAEIRASQLEEERGEAEMEAEGVGFFREFDGITERLRKDDLDPTGRKILEAMRTKVLYEVSERDELMQEREQLIENVKYLKERTEDYKKEKSEAWTDYYNTKKKLDAEIKRLSAEIEALRKARAGFGEVERQIKLHDRTIERIRRLKQDEVGEVRYIVSKVLQAQGHRFSSSEFIISNMSETVYDLITKDVERGYTVGRSWGKVATFSDLKSQIRSLESIVKSLEEINKGRKSRIDILVERNESLEKESNSVNESLSSFGKVLSEMGIYHGKVLDFGQIASNIRVLLGVKEKFRRAIHRLLWEKYTDSENYGRKVPKVYELSEGTHFLINPNEEIKPIEKDEVETIKAKIETEIAKQKSNLDKTIEKEEPKEKESRLVKEIKMLRDLGLIVPIGELNKKKATKKEPSFHDWAKKRVDEDLKRITEDLKHINFTKGRA